MGGEDSVNATSGIDFGLLDLAFNIPLTTTAGPTSRSASSWCPTAASSSPTRASGLRRHLDGAARLRGGARRRPRHRLQARPVTLIGGVFTGGGRDVPPDHYLPQRFGIPELVARIGIGDLDEDPFYLRQSDLHPDRTRYQVSVSGLYTRDSTVGHSTILNVKSVDKSILIDSDWNPYIAAGGVGHFSQGDWYQAGADAAVRSPLGGNWAFAGEAQFDYAGYSNGYGSHDHLGRARPGRLPTRPVRARSCATTCWSRATSSPTAA